MNEEHNNSTNLRETLKLPRLNTQDNNESDLPELKRQLVRRYQRKLKNEQTTNEE